MSTKDPLFDFSRDNGAGGLTAALPAGALGRWDLFHLEHRPLHHVQLDRRAMSGRERLSCWAGGFRGVIRGGFVSNAHIVGRAGVCILSVPPIPAATLAAKTSHG